VYFQRQLQVGDGKAAQLGGGGICNNHTDEYGPPSGP
jgi:hypothetical protein